MNKIRHLKWEISALRIQWYHPIVPVTFGLITKTTYFENEISLQNNCFSKMRKFFVNFLNANDYAKYLLAAPNYFKAEFCN